jgi:hypothetical protein
MTSTNREVASLPSLLAEVSERHEWETPRGYAFVVCSCGEEFAEEHQARTHVAAELTEAVAAWIEADEQVEAVRDRSGLSVSEIAPTVVALAALARTAGEPR